MNALTQNYFFDNSRRQKCQKTSPILGFGMGISYGLCGHDDRRLDKNSHTDRGK